MTIESQAFEGFHADRDKSIGLARTHYESVKKIIAMLAAYDPDVPELKLEAPLRESLQLLHDELQHPLVRIAAIGTTSSAKSSLLNFLSGISLLPTGVQEKSAGSVRIINAPAISLEIEETEGALWQCGNIEVSGQKEITEILDEVMSMYRKAVNQGEELEAPSVVIHYPLQLSEILGLPASFRLELMDLPGLKFTGDERNLRVMRQCRDAMCLVTLGSQETDPMRQQVLLEEAMEQVRNIGSPIARMLFVITRVDEFLLREPQNWPQNEDEYVEDRINAILEELHREMPEQEIPSIAHSRISPMPALYSLELEDPEKREQTYDLVQRSYYGLIRGGKNRDWRYGIDPQIDLSTDKFRLWNEKDWSIIANQLQESSGAIEFLETLRSHVANNLSEIILPPLISRYVATAEESSDAIKDHINLLIAAMTQNFEGQRERLKKTGEELHKVNEEGAKRLHEFMAYCYANLFQQCSRSQQLENYQKITEKFPEFAVPSLFTMAQWPSLMEEAYLWPIKSIKERLIDGKPLPNTLPFRTELDSALLKLMRVHYTRQDAINGGKKTLKSAYEKELLLAAFNRMTALCNKCIKASLKNEFARQTDNVLIALEDVQDAYLAMIDGMLDKVPEEFAHVVQISPQALKKFTMENSPETADVAIALKTTIKKFKESKIMENLAEGGFWLHDKIVNLYRKITRTDTKKVEEEKTEYIVEVPSIVKYEREMTANFQKSFETLQKQMLDIARTQIGVFLDNIRNCQDARIAAYEKKLEEVMGAKKQVLTHQQQDLDNILQNLNAVNSALKEWRSSL